MFSVSAPHTCLVWGVAQGPRLSRGGQERAVQSSGPSHCGAETPCVWLRRQGWGAWTCPGTQTGRCLAPVAVWLPSHRGSRQSWVRPAQPLLLAAPAPAVCGCLPRAAGPAPSRCGVSRVRICSDFSKYVVLRNSTSGRPCAPTPAGPRDPCELCSGPRAGSGGGGTPLCATPAARRGGAPSCLPELCLPPPVLPVMCARLSRDLK